MGRYIKWNHVQERYPDIEDVGDAQEVGRAFLEPAEFELDAKLSSRFSVPFSSNNETAKDLAIDMTYLKASPTRSKNWERIKKYVDERIMMLTKGQMGMITTSIDLISGDRLRPISTTSGDPVVFQNVSSSQITYGVDILPSSG